MGQFTKALHNPMELISNFWPGADISHITYGPDLKLIDGQYSCNEQCGHDGTLFFTIEMLQKCLLPIINQTTHHVPSAPSDVSKVIGMKYKIGKMRHVTVFGMLELVAGNYSGQRERVRMPVICEYVY